MEFIKVGLMVSIVFVLFWTRTASRVETFFFSQLIMLKVERIYLYYPVIFLLLDKVCFLIVLIWLVSGKFSGNSGTVRKGIIGMLATNSCSFKLVC